MNALNCRVRGARIVAKVRERLNVTKVRGTDRTDGTDGTEATDGMTVTTDNDSFMAVVVCLYDTFICLNQTSLCGYRG